MMNPLPANRIQAGSQAGTPRINLLLIWNRRQPML
jgi:hypothetical protein